MSASAKGKPSGDGVATLFLAVDGGGSKTHAVVVDSHGAVRGRGSAGSSNLRAIGVEQTLVQLRAAIAEALPTNACCNVDTAWFGLAGIHGADGANLLAPHLLSVAREVAITNDAEFALAGLDSNPGVALIAGTGSIALGRDASGQIIQVGGWGHLLGDEGSAYDIGRRAAQAAARAADGRGPSTALLQLVLERWDLATPRQMIEHVYLTQEKAPIASLAPDVLALARRGDQVARAIRRQACEELAQTVIAVIDALNIASPVPLILGGGLLIHERDLRAAVVARIRRRRALGRVTLVKEPALWAARSLAARARSMAGDGVAAEETEGVL
ncbi:MAG TPA: BadF/BadG/BcrA/BcrD ATPase family protein [Ktedonobacterales bacterium]|nr:BadF/BadG/BcrA/BcrD ATPase family protein [Ktedonobacterales bacterium]